MRKGALFLIGLYQKISFVFPARCKYIPSCSEYAKQAFSRHFFLKALLLSLFRIIRCNPFTKGGFDPLPRPDKGWDLC